MVRGYNFNIFLNPRPGLKHQKLSVRDYLIFLLRSSVEYGFLLSSNISSYFK